MNKPRVLPHGDSAFVVRFPDDFSSSQHERLLALATRFERERHPAVVDVVPGHTELLIVIDAEAPTAEQVGPWCESLCARLPTRAERSLAPPTRVIPVCFEPPFALDLAARARDAAMSEEAFVAAFVAPTYRCTVVGFRPGFPYLVGLDPALSAPRHATPRAHVPRGSVGLAHLQAGIYPVDGPGGWQIVGRTPLRLFEPARAQCLVQPGDEVRFEVIDAALFAKLAAA